MRASETSWHGNPAVQTSERGMVAWLSSLMFFHLGTVFQCFSRIVRQNLWISHWKVVVKPADLKPRSNPPMPVKREAMRSCGSAAPYWRAGSSLSCKALGLGSLGAAALFRIVFVFALRIGDRQRDVTGKSARLKCADCLSALSRGARRACLLLPVGMRGRVPRGGAVSSCAGGAGGARPDRGPCFW